MRLFDSRIESIPGPGIFARVCFEKSLILRSTWDQLAADDVDSLRLKGPQWQRTCRIIAKRNSLSWRAVQHDDKRQASFCISGRKYGLAEATSALATWKLALHHRIVQLMLSGRSTTTTYPTGSDPIANLCRAAWIISWNSTGTDVLILPACQFQRRGLLSKSDDD